MYGAFEDCEEYIVAGRIGKKPRIWNKKEPMHRHSIIKLLKSKQKE